MITSARTLTRRSWPPCTPRSQSSRWAPTTTTAIPRVARYAPWCGTRASESFHRRYRALVSVHGHLHVRATDERDGVRFEEVSLGYPGHWDQTRAVDNYLRRIL